MCIILYHHELVFVKDVTAVAPPLRYLIVVVCAIDVVLFFFFVYCCHRVHFISAIICIALQVCSRNGGRIILMISRRFGIFVMLYYNGGGIFFRLSADGGRDNRDFYKIPHLTVFNSVVIERECCFAQFSKKSYAIEV